jgi:acetyltransferase
MTSEGMFDRARALAWCPLPKGRRVAVITNAGGPGVTAADALESLGLELAEFSDETRAALSEILSPAASLNNPVDMLAAAGPKQFAESLRIVLADPQVDSAMVIYPTPPMYTSGAVAKAIIPVIHSGNKPVVVAVMGERLIQEAVEHLRAAHIPEYRFPERAAAALSALVDRSELLAFADAEPIIIPDVESDLVASIIADVIPDSESSGNGFLPPEKNQAILEAYGIPTMKIALARDVEEAVNWFQEMGSPVALKVSSADIPHKSDVGGVILDLKDIASVRKGYDVVTRNAREAYPDARIDGVYVQRMVPSGQEIIIGAVQDPQFGALVMFGSGGIEVEGLKDLSFGLAPLTGLEAEAMIQSTWAGRKLMGYRNLPPADRQAVLEVLFRIAQLAADHPDLAEIEINPLRVLPDGQGAVAVDVRIRKRE